MQLPFVRRSLLQDTKRELEDQASRAQQLQDQLRRAEAERDLYRDQAASASAEAREALRMVADWLAEHQFGQKIFGSSGPSLPSETPNMDLLEAFNQRQTKRRGRDVVRAGQEQFVRDLRSRLQPTTNEELEALMPKEVAQGLNMAQGS